MGPIPPILITKKCCFLWHVANTPAVVRESLHRRHGLCVASETMRHSRSGAAAPPEFVRCLSKSEKDCQTSSASQASRPLPAFTRALSRQSPLRKQTAMAAPTRWPWNTLISTSMLATAPTWARPLARGTRRPSYKHGRGRGAMPRGRRSGRGTDGTPRCVAQWCWHEPDGARFPVGVGTSPVPHRHLFPKRAA